MNEKQKKSIIMVILLVLVISLSVAYAALASRLTITGTVKVEGNWNIHFDTNTLNRIDTNSFITPDASLGIATFTLNVDLEKPGDMVAYTFDVVNEGTIDAQVSSIVLPDFAAFKTHHLIYQLSYYTLNNEEIILTSEMSDAELQTATATIKADILEKGSVIGDTVQVSSNGRRSIKISVSYKDITADEFGNNTSDIPLQLETTILYIQATK